MAMTQIPDVSYQIDGDTITLEQGQIEPCTVELHRIHLQHIAGELGIPTLDASATVIKRRFEVVRDGLNRLAETDYYREDIIDHCKIGLEFLTELDDLCKLANEFLDDLAPLPASCVANSGKEKA